MGEWSENGRIHGMFADGDKVSSKRIQYFQDEGLLFPNASDEDPNNWSDQRVVCNCMSVTKGRIRACMESCQHDPGRVARVTQASTVCGSCRPLLEQLCGSVSSGVARGFSVKALFITSLLAFTIVAYCIAAPAAPMATSVESWWYQVDQLWRDNILKQITGYSLVGIFLVGLLISLRKRFSWFTFGKFTSWRFFHAAFGLTALLALYSHTGFHFGHNLNFWLMFVFVAMNLLGALAGVVTAIEGSANTALAVRVRRFRPLLTWMHLVLFWPLPVLLTFHIISAYSY